MSKMFLFYNKLALSNKNVVFFYVISLLFLTLTLVCLSSVKRCTSINILIDEKLLTKEANLLSDVIQNQIYKLQNPDNCERARKLLCEVATCGFGCQIHALVSCFFHAYRTNRTVVLINPNFLYGATDWETFFDPVSVCQNPILMKNSLDDEVLEEHYKFHSMGSLKDFEIPDDFAISIQRFHKRPTAWWIGQFLKYIIKLKPNVESNIEKKMESLGFKSPIIGVHIRTTDKVKEAKLHDADEYMTVVDNLYDHYFKQNTKGQPKLFVISDNKNPIQEIKEKYPKYEVISDLNDTKLTKTLDRKLSSSVMPILMDIILLSKCDYVVCTFSSNVCRLAYELKQISTLDAPDKFYSLDWSYCFLGMKE